MRYWINIGLAFLLLVGQVQAQTVKELEKQRKQAEAQLAETKRLLNETNKNEKATTNKLGLLRRDIQTRKTMITGIQSELGALDQEMEELTQRKGELAVHLDSLRKDYAELVRKTHYAQMRRSPLLFVLSADSFQQLFRRMRYLQEFSAYRRQQAAEIEAVQDEIDKQNARLSANRKSKADVLKMREREQENLKRDEKKQQSMLNELGKQKKQLLAQQKKQQKKANELNKKIDELIAAEAKKKTASSMTKEEKLISGNFEKNKGKLPWPTEKGYISGQFGVQAHPTLKGVTVNNKGIYIQTEAGSNCRSVYEGVVTAVFVSNGTNCVIVRHGTYLTVYSNLTTLYVKNGDKVQTKQKIGKIATDAENDNQTVLHFQVRKETEVLNPSQWLAH